MSSAVIRTLNFYVFFNSSNIRENSLIQATTIQNDSQHKYDTRLCGVSGILLLCLPVSSLFHFVPNIRVLTKQRPWRWTTNWRNRQVINSNSPCTMLQKISKSEVKAWLCWNVMILPPLRFCVRSHFGKFKQSKMSFMVILATLNFEFW